MKDKKMYVLVVISILFAVVGVSLAFFSLNIIGNDKAKDTKITTGDLELVFTDDNEVSLDGAFPGDSIIKTISVKNTGTKEVSYNIVWQELLNEITNNELVIDGTCKNLNSSNTEDGTCSAISKKAVKEGNITSNIPIKPGYTQEYEVKITFIDTGRLQNYNKNKSFKGKLGLTESSAKTIYCTYDGELTQGAEYVNGQYTYRYMQEHDATAWNNITSDGWGVILTDKDSTDPVTSELCTYINDKPLVSMSYMSYGSQATSINAKNYNTSNVTNMYGTFSNTVIETLSLNSFNTSSVTSMQGMFGRTQATFIDLSSFDTNSVINMGGMFAGSQATSLDLSSFDTNNATNMSAMFYVSANLKTIYVSDKFDISKVTNSESMFNNCTNLVGGAGTAYDSTKTDKTYARIDKGTSNPGYFTDIAEKPVEPYSFSTDSWSTIANAVKNNNISKYNVGDTKTIDMGDYGTHTVRVANTSTPDECKTVGFSQTACGFVVEFADIITTHKMNNTLPNVGGWPASGMYTFVNNDIYNLLPYILKSRIIDTLAISSHGSEDTDNFTTTSKLYLLAPKEIYTDFSNSYDTAKDLTRTLDYYIAQGVTTNNYSGAIKKNENNDGIWWLRSANSNTNKTFFRIENSGTLKYYESNRVSGVSPAFRIG